MRQKVSDFILRFLEKTRPQKLTDAEVTWSTVHINDLAFDSLDLTMLSLEIEEEFGMEISVEQIGRVATVGHLISLIEESAGGR